MNTQVLYINFEKHRGVLIEALKKLKRFYYVKKIFYVGCIQAAPVGHLKLIHTMHEHKHRYIFTYKTR